ncbi:MULTISPECIES: hypothetical protein [Streptomyces]|uniref:Pilus assembly protein n=1 Tax=Streptomyces virginiae TaxID=1961 RepID=A0ABQ3NDS3_STRVG|nr:MULTISPECIES: hypothetical protein [Streptomyces]MBP2346201.1 hypothetical protein [Streptomyces virginiae]MCI4083457.1 hypothetical protein [Streptomyces sp. MMS21 TC-5]GGQ35620.1 hypothetical protein GCM10010215_69400 [Streptomyces virginiae]GHI10887.1 hypothetical protein Scinn_03500 [Streptomyces virginiae]
MSQNTLLKAAVEARIRVNGWADTAVTRLRKRHAQLDRGQTAFEYLGIILVVIVIVGAIVGSGVGSEITKRIKQAVTDIKAG